MAQNDFLSEATKRKKKATSILLVALYTHFAVNGRNLFC
jgi:hypothetical protein